MLFYFHVVFLKNQNISNTFLQKTNKSPCDATWKKHAFFLYSTLI